MNIFILLWMFFNHIFDDFFLQGCLSSLKQKTWWEAQNNYKDLYKNDYKMALFMHSFSWSFLMMLPIFYFNCFNLNGLMLIFFIINIIIHYITDDTKANKLKINLVTDQFIHIIQIIVSWIIFIVI